MKLYEKFSIEELQNILQTSNTYEEALEKIGYTINSSNRKNIREISEKYDIDISHFVNKQTKNLINQRFGRLVVIKKIPSPRSTARWLCRCDCGALTEVDSNHLRSKAIQSCGCMHKEQLIDFNKTTKLLDLIGQRFGQLVVISRAENIGKQPAWVCKCDCGTITHPIMGSNLRAGVTTSCGCLVSKGEAKIRELFNQYSINYKTQITFSDCLSDKLAPLKFDFGVYNENNELLYLIEYQGIQHYYEVSWTRDNLAVRQMRDKLKQEYCKNNNIPLLIIPYTKFQTLDIDDLIIKELKKI